MRQQPGIAVMNLSIEERACNELIELKLLQEAIFLKYGYDFRDYHKSHFRRRLEQRMLIENIGSISEMLSRIIYDADLFHRLLKDLSINVTEMFRDPELYLYLRSEIIPRLKTYPFLKVWHAGCSTGEEVYSMCILFREEGLYDKTRFYATDFNQAALNKAIEGIYPLSKIKNYTENYLKSGGDRPFSEYYHTGSDHAIFDKSLSQNIVFSDHNLVSDGVFGEMNMIVCRNVLIYFNKKLKNNVLNLFNKSLVPGGFLCLGTKESFTDSDAEACFEVHHHGLKVFKKVYQPFTYNDPVIEKS